MLSEGELENRTEICWIHFLVPVFILYKYPHTQTHRYRQTDTHLRPKHAEPVPRDSSASGHGHQVTRRHPRGSAQQSCLARVRNLPQPLQWRFYQHRKRSCLISALSSCIFLILRPRILCSICRPRSFHLVLSNQASAKQITISNYFSGFRCPNFKGKRFGWAPSQLKASTSKELKVLLVLVFLK